MADYSVFSLDGVTEYPLPQPNNRTWNHTPRAPFADGTPRRSALASVEWKFSRLSAANFQKFELYAAADATIIFRTWKAPSGGTAAQQVKCVGKLIEKGGFLGTDGDYHNVLVRFAYVQETA